MSNWWLIGSLVLVGLLACGLLFYPLRRQYAVSVCLIPVVVIALIIGYYNWGGFFSWQHYQQQQQSKLQAERILKTIKSPQELIDKLRAKLDDAPQSAKGWYLLGRIYLSENDTQNAVKAFAKAYHFNPDDERYAVNYAQSLWDLNHRKFSAEIREIMQHILAKSPNQPDALSMMAMDAYFARQYPVAVAYWERLLKLVPAGSDEARTIQKAISKASVPSGDGR